MGVHRGAELGLGRSTITRRLASGQLVRVLPAIYSTAEPDYFERCVAVTLWKRSAVLSHLSAAWLWGMLDDEPTTVSVTLPLSTQRAAPEWVEMHRRRLTEKRCRRGLPVVTRAQTFVDVAATLAGEDLEKFFDRAIRTPVERRQLVVLCERSANMTGMKALRRELRKCVLNTRSEAERVVGRAMTSKNFYMDINARVGPFFGDFVDYRARVIVEIDGREFHTAPDVFNNDRRRQNIVVLDRWLILRYSAVQAMGDTERVVDEIIVTVRARRRSRA